nr:hypothetical protein [Deltaproteobacteria bacterium]
MKAYAVLVPGLAASAPADADVRAFTETYEYSTQPEGTTSVQLWHTARRVTWDEDYAEEFEHRIEIKHGVSEHWDVATSTVLVQSGRNGLTLDRVVLGPRYRFADRAEWPVDVTLALEAGKVADRSIYPLELRVVAARDIDSLTLAANGIVGVQVGADVIDEVDLAIGWAAGASYQLHNKLRIGAETWGGTADEGPRPPTDGVNASVGPVVHVAPSSKLWVTGTAGFGLTDNADVVAV